MTGSKPPKDETPSDAPPNERDEDEREQDKEAMLVPPDPGGPGHIEPIDGQEGSRFG
jgi:hypothetical protein